MKPKRIFQVYRECTVMRPQKIDGPDTNDYVWRFRVLAPQAPVAHRIVGGSGESFHSRGNALRAARREASLYPPGVAAVEIEGQGK